MGRYDHLTREQLIKQLEEYDQRKDGQLCQILGSKRQTTLIQQNNSYDFEEEIMRIALEHYQADRTFISKFNWRNNTNSNIVEACSKDVLHQIQTLQQLPNAAISGFIEKFKQNFPVIIDNISNIEDNGYQGCKSTQVVFQRLNLKSVLLFPIKISGKLWGYIGVEMMTSHKTWSDNDIAWIHTFTNILYLGINQKQALAEIAKKEQRFTGLFQNMPIGYVRHQIVYDQDNQPVDYKFLEINPAFEKLTGLMAKDCLGKTASQIGGKLNEELFKQYVDVALNGKQLQFDYFTPILNRWYNSVLYSPTQGEFISLFYDITKQYEANEQVRQNENKLRTIFNNMPVGIILFDNKGNILDINDETLQILGLTHKQQLKQNHWLTPEIQEQLQIQDHITFNFAYDKITQDILQDTNQANENTLFAAGKLLTYNNEQTSSTEYMLIIVDNTGHNQAFRKIRENEEIWSQVAQVSNMFKWKYNIITGKFTVSDEILQYHISSEKDFSPEELFHIYLNQIKPQDFEKMQNKWAKCLQNEANIPYDLNYRVEIDGKQYHCSSRWIKRVEENSETIYGITTDISEFMRTEKALKENLLRMSLILETGDIYPWHLDVETGKLDIGEKFYEDFQQDKTRFQHYSAAKFIKHIHPEDVGTYKKACKELRTGQIAKLRIEVRLNICGNKYWWCELNAAARTRGRDSDVSKLLGFLTVIQERKDNEIKRIEALEKAKEADKLKSAFLANVSHEIRTPLNAIVGFSEIIANTDCDEEKNLYLDIIKTNNNLLLNLINDILDLSKIESGRMDLKQTNVNVTDLCQDLYQIHQLRAAQGVQVVFKNKEKEPLILFTDRNRLHQIYSNLINNAIKNTTVGSIIISYQTRGNFVDFFVKDTGKGIPLEKQGLIFNRFEKLDSNVQGFGLGLSICKSILERMGGDISFQSEPGVGTEFKFTLPYHQQKTEVPKATVTNTLNKPTKQNNSQEITILVAEDIDCNYQLIEAILNKKFCLLRARSGMEAVTLFSEKHPDLILMDMKMPELDGMEATRIIRELSPDIPIIALTAFAYDNDKDAALSIGCNDYITKPVDTKRLRAIIEKYTLKNN